jgi:hypothetical protein
LEQAKRWHESPEPIGAEYLLSWFWQLSNKRSNGFGLSPIIYGSIVDWKSLFHIETEPWEVVVLDRLDVAFLNAQSSNSRKAQPETEGEE